MRLELNGPVTPRVCGSGTLFIVDEMDAGVADAGLNQVTLTGLDSGVTFSYSGTCQSPVQGPFPVRAEGLLVGIWAPRPGRPVVRVEEASQRLNASQRTLDVLAQLSGALRTDGGSCALLELQVVKPSNGERLTDVEGGIVVIGSYADGGAPLLYVDDPICNGAAAGLVTLFDAGVRTIGVRRSRLAPAVLSTVGPLLTLSIWLPEGHDGGNTPGTGCVSGADCGSRLCGGPSSQPACLCIPPGGVTYAHAPPNAHCCSGKADGGLCL